MSEWEQTPVAESRVLGTSLEALHQTKECSGAAVAEFEGIVVNKKSQHSDGNLLPPYDPSKTEAQRKRREAGEK